MSQPNILIPLVKISLSKLNSNGYGTELRKNCSSGISTILKLAIQFHARVNKMPYFFTERFLTTTPRLNTQSCIKGLFLVQDFCFWAVWAARPVHKKKVGADYQQLLRTVSHVFGVKKNLKTLQLLHYIVHTDAFFQISKRHQQTCQRTGFLKNSS